MSKLNSVTSNICVSGLNETFVPRRAGLARLLQSPLRDAAHVFLLVGVAVAPYLKAQQLGKEVYDRYADAVQSARHLVCVSIEFAARVQLRQHHFGGRDLLGLVYIDRDPAPVVDNGYRIIYMDEDFDAVAVTGERFVYGIINDFIDQVVEAHLARRADIHGRPFTNGLTPFEHRDGSRAVILC